MIRSFIKSWSVLAVSLLLAVVIGGILLYLASMANAAPHSGPGKSPGGTYFTGLVPFCFQDGTNRSYLEWNTGDGTIGNCPPGWTQAWFQSMPTPAPAVTVTVTAPASSPAA